MAKRPTKKEEFKPEVYARYREYTNKYIKENYTQFLVKLNKVQEKDVLEKLDSVGNKRQYIIKLIRKDIESSEN